VNVAKIGLSYYLLSLGHGVRSIALVFLGCHFATLFLQWPVLFRYIRVREVSTDWSFCRDLLRRTWRFLGIDSLIAVWASINTLLLSWFAGEAAVGLYAAAWQLLVPVSMTFQAVVNGLFPILCRRADDNRERFGQLTVLLLEILTIVAVPGCILLYFGAGPIISALYGDENFSHSALVLRIMIPVLLMQAICNTFGQVLFSRRQEHVTLRIIAIDVAFNAICGTTLIYAFGLMGAAVTLLLTWTLNAGLHIAATRDLLADETGRGLAWNSSLLWRIVAAGCIMAGALAASDHFNFVVTSIVTSLLYLVVLGVLIYAACRHSVGIRERFLVPLKEQ
jgi:O-antigen/teichoic acid export membrane protein